LVSGSAEDADTHRDSSTRPSANYSPILIELNEAEIKKEAATRNLKELDISLRKEEASMTEKTTNVAEQLKALEHEKEQEQDKINKKHAKKKQSIEEDLWQQNNQSVGVVEGLRVGQEGAQLQLEAAQAVQNKYLSMSPTRNTEMSRTRAVASRSDGLLEWHQKVVGVRGREELDGFELAVLSGVG